ncbi:MAG TPA: carbohydrate ABC transporter permease [Alphaproteobacteria bacterium]|nr:carbohydrate ABC transporter permease [Alphaproteobacteria bacterium]
MFPAPLHRRPRAVQAAYRAALAASLSVWLLPLAAIALTSIRSMDDLNSGNYWGWPEQPQLVANYAAVLLHSEMTGFIVNSFLITLPAVAGTLVLSSMAGFALARYRFKANLALLVMFIAGNLVPFQILMIPVRGLMLDLGLYDTRWALILFHTAFQTGFCTLFMRNFFRQLPEALFDAARLDGWSELRIFWQIGLPLVRPALAAMAAIVFTFVWNDYFWSLVLVHSNDVRPVTSGLQSLRGMWVASWNLIAAGSLVAALPPVVLFFLMQRHFIAGLTSGAPEE